VAALNGIRRRAVRPASHTRVAHKDFDFPADEWLRRRLTDISRDSVAVLLPEGIEAVRPSVFCPMDMVVIVALRNRMRRGRGLKPRSTPRAKQRSAGICYRLR
jgi:hypothetical protein